MWLLVLIWAVPSLSRDTFWHIFIEGNRNDCQIKHDDTWIYIQGGNVNKCMISNTVNMYICPSAWYPIPSTCTYVTKLGYQTLSQPSTYVTKLGYQTLSTTLPTKECWHTGGKYDHLRSQHSLPWRRCFAFCSLPTYLLVTKQCVNKGVLAHWR